MIINDDKPGFFARRVATPSRRIWSALPLVGACGRQSSAFTG